MKRARALLLSGLLLAGCPNDGDPGTPGGPGPGGPVGSEGPPGIPALDRDAALPGVVVAILSIEGATGADGSFRPGDTLRITFTVTTRAGTPLPLQDLDFDEIYAAGPTTNYQPVLARRTDVRAAATQNPDGSWTYAFPTPLPRNHLPPLNDSDAVLFDPGARQTELTGRPLAPGTYSVGMALYKNYSIDGKTYRDAGNAVGHFLFGGATVLRPRGVVAADACNACHGEVRAHGGIRRDVALCLLCHGAGAEDRPSADPAKATPGATIDFAAMVHAIHRGRELRAVRATANGAKPFRYQLVGFGENVHDYSDVVFPQMPGGTGFNQQTRNCEACHAGAAEPDAYWKRPSRAACGACHDDVDFADGTKLDFSLATVSGGLLAESDLHDPAYRTDFHVPQADDSSCVGCHGDTVPDLAVRAVHRPPLLVDAAPTTPGKVDLAVELLAVSGATGAGGAFRAGDTLSVTFRVVDGLGNPVAVDTGTSAVQGVFSGPTGNYQKLLPAGNTSTVNLRTGLVGAGPHTVAVGVIPATFPAPLNDSKRASNPALYPGWTGGDPFTLASGSGELKGLPLAAGTYTVAVWAQRQFTRNGTTYREASRFATVDVLVASAAATPAILEPKEDVVTDARCNACHLDLRFHGNGRKGVRGCVLCHASGAEDNRRNAASTFEAPEPDTIDFRVMIHKIHAARELSVVREGGRYDLAGFGGSGAVPQDFSTGYLPAMPGGPAHCTACHANDAWRAPRERADVRIWAKACGACHDSAAAAAHFGVNTAGTVTTGDPATTTVEACAVCHGPGQEYSVERVHRQR